MNAPIFFKDLRGNFAIFTMVPIVLGGLYLFQEYLLRGAFGVALSEPQKVASMVVSFAAFGGIMAIAMATRVLAQERDNGTLTLLERLPISRTRLLAEKIGAALPYLVIVYLVALVYLAQVDLGLAFKNPTGLRFTVEGNFFYAIFGSFVISLVVSAFITHSLSVLILSIGISLVSYVIVATFFTHEPDFGVTYLSLMWMLIFFVVPVAIFARRWRPGATTGLWKSSPPFAEAARILIDNSLLHGGVILVVVLAVVQVVFVEPPQDGKSLDPLALYNLLATFILCMGIILAAALGTRLYSEEECDANRSLLHYLPVPLGQLFVIRNLATLPSVILIGASVGATSELYDLLPAVVGSLFIYSLAQQMRLWLMSAVLTLTASLGWSVSILVMIMLWMMPRDLPVFFRGFEPIHDPTYVGLYAAALITLGSTITAYYMATSTWYLTRSPARRLRVQGATTLTCLTVTCGVVALIRTFVAL